MSTMYYVAILFGTYIITVGSILSLTDSGVLIGTYTVTVLLIWGVCYLVSVWQNNRSRK